LSVKAPKGVNNIGNLSKNLSRSEFACKCRCGFDTADIETVRVIQDVCDHFECSVVINSGCRCEAHNTKVGGTKGSKHLEGRAADCVFVLKGTPINPTEVHYYLVSEYPKGYGFGLYASFNHIDTRSGPPARWEA